MPTPAFDPEVMLAHDRYLRDLAHSLIVDPQRAEDLAQQVWIAALERRPDGASLHAWLAGTLRHLWAKLRRGDARRAAREREAARSEALPSVAELWARESARHALASAVLALDEPYRATIALRYFEGLPPRAVGKRMGVPVETVRTRTRRGLECLRERLDREHGGDRAVWCASLLPIAYPDAGAGGGAGLLTGALLVTTKVKIAVAALAAAALTFALWPLVFPSPPPSDTGRSGPLAAAVQAAAPAGEPLPSAPSARVEVPAPPPATTGALLVRAVWAEDQAPAAGIGVGIRPRVVQQPMFAERAATTDARGEARFADLEPGPVAVRLTNGARGDAEIVVGREAELRIELATGTTVEGTVVDWQGAPVAGADILRSMLASLATGEVVGRADARGVFRVRGLVADGPAIVLISARAAGFAPSPRRDVNLAAGATARLELVLPAAGGGVHGRVRGPDGRPVADALVRVARLPRGVPVADARTGADGEFQVVGLAAGEHEVGARAPDLAAATATVQIEAIRDAAVALDLVAGVTIEGRIAEGADKPAAGVMVAAGKPPGFGYTATTTAADGTYVLRGLAAGEIALRAGGASARGRRGLAEGRLTAHVGERLRWDARLADGLTIRGRVLDEEGRALPGAVVQGNIAGIPGRDGHRDSARTDAEGRFTLKNWMEGDTRLTVTADGNEPFPRACVDGVRAGPDEVVIALRAADRPSVRIRGVLLDADGRPATARLAPIPVSRPFELAGLGAFGIDPATGSFELGPLPAGWWLVRIDSNGCPSCSIPVRELAPGQTFDAGIVRLPRPGSLRVMAKGADGGAIRKATFEIGTADDAIVEHLAIEKGAGRIALAPGRYLVQAQADGCAAQCLPVEIAAGAESTLDVAFASGVVHTLRFAAPAGCFSRILHEVIRDAQQRVVADAWLWGPCDRDWKLGLAAGRYTLEATTPNGFRGSAAFTAAPGSAPTLVELR